MEPPSSSSGPPSTSTGTTQLQGHWAYSPLGMGFVLLAFVCSLPFFFLFFLAGLSVRSDVVFALEALLGGALANLILRHKFAKELLLWSKPRIPMIWGWVLVCLYIALARPFESPSP